jgi:drug/metabolite transporter (DMT)-like permease
MNKGVKFSLLTAVISGISIFVNKFAVKGLDSSLFVFMKNIIVAVFLFSLIMLFSQFKELKKLSKKDYGKLTLIGIFGGSIPFILFFKGLQLTSAVNASFLHKTMFIWVSLMALFFLKEKLDRKWIIAAVFLLAGNILILKLNSFSFGIGEVLILIAALFWSIETIISKNALKDLSPRVVGFGRMFFGSFIVLVYIAVTGEIAGIFNVTLTQISWILITSVFLLMYVSFWYTGLKYTEASTATAILLIGSVVTIVLSAIFLQKVISLSEVIGMILLVAGSFILARKEIVFKQTAKNKI